MKNTNKSYVDRVVENFKSNAIASPLTSSTDSETATENVKAKATESAEHQNHSLQDNDI